MKRANLAPRLLIAGERMHQPWRGRSRKRHGLVAKRSRHGFATLTLRWRVARTRDAVFSPSARVTTIIEKQQRLVEQTKRIDSATTQEVRRMNGGEPRVNDLRVMRHILVPGAVAPPALRSASVLVHYVDHTHFESRGTRDVAPPPPLERRVARVNYFDMRIVSTIVARRSQPVQAIACRTLTDAAAQRTRVTFVHARTTRMSMLPEARVALSLIRTAPSFGAGGAIPRQRHAVADPREAHSNLKPAQREAARRPGAAPAVQLRHAHTAQHADRVQAVPNQPERTSPWTQPERIAQLGRSELSGTQSQAIIREMLSESLIDRVADDVVRRMEKRMRIDRERRGV